MTNTIQRTLADTAGFIPQAWANEALDVLRRNIVLAKFVAKDSDFTQGAWKGKTLNIPYPGTFTASAKTPGSIATVAQPSNGNSVNVTLSNHNTVDFILEDLAFDSAQNGISMMESYGQAAGIALAEQLETDLHSLVGSFTNDSVRHSDGTGIGANVNYGAIVAARKQLVDNKAPMSDRALILSTKDYAAALQDSSLLGYFQYNSVANNNPDAIAQGLTARLMGMDVYESQFIPASGTTAQTVQTMAMSGTPTGGYTVATINSNSSGHIAYNATAAQVEAALAAITGVGVGQIRVTGTWASNGTMTVVQYGATPYAITFDNGSHFSGGSSPVVTVADVSATTTATSNLALHKNAVLLAVRPMTAPSTAGVEVAYANDPDSGVGLRIQMQYQPQYRGVYVAYDILYGFAAIRPNQAAVILG